MEKIVYFVLFTLMSIQLGSSLKCYSCVPGDGNKCTNINAANKPTEEDCSPEETVCLSLYSKTNIEEVSDGVYRSCFQPTDNTKDPCDNYADSGYNFTDCASCKENLCNVQELRSTPFKCYNCNPNGDYDNCEIIGDKKPSEEICHGYSKDFVCISAYTPNSSEGKKEGVYRSCFKAGENAEDACAVFTEENSNEKFEKCISCTGDLCNTDDIKNGARRSFSVLAIIPIFYSIFVLLTK